MKIRISIVWAWVLLAAAPVVAQTTDGVQAGKTEKTEAATAEPAKTLKEMLREFEKARCPQYKVLKYVDQVYFDEADVLDSLIADAKARLEQGQAEAYRQMKAVGPELSKQERRAEIRKIARQLREFGKQTKSQLRTLGKAKKQARKVYKSTVIFVENNYPWIVFPPKELLTEKQEK